MKALVIGGESLIGERLFQALQRRGDTAQRTTRRAGRSGESWVELDLAAPLPASLPQCDIAFFCAAMTGFAANRESPVLAHRVNASAPVEIARRLAARVVFLSTSAVLDCQEPRMRADRPYAPRGAYGAHKADAERGFLALGERAAVLRLTKVFATGDQRVAQWLRELREGRPIRAFSDHRFSPLAPEHVVGALLAIAERGGAGIYQVSGRDDLSYAELGERLARRCGADPRLVEAIPASTGLPADEVTPYTSLDVSRLQELNGFVAPGADAVLDGVP